MLRKLAIRDFRSIRSCDLALGRLNLFIGANGAGKSNVLEAIGMLSAALGRGVTPRDLETRGVRLSTPAMYKSSFKDKRLPRQFGLTGTWQNSDPQENAEYSCGITAGVTSESLAISTESLSVGGKKIFSKTVGGKITINPPEIDELLKLAIGKITIKQSQSIYDVIFPFLDIKMHTAASFSRLEEYAIFAPQTAILRGQATETKPMAPLGLSGGQLAPALAGVLHHNRKIGRDIETFIRKSFGWVEDVNVGAPDADIVSSYVSTLKDIIYFTDRYMKGKRNNLSVYDASEGVLYLLFIATLLNHPEAPKVFALDNVDGTLNPALVRVLVRHLVTAVGEDDTRQIFMTSHNPTALDELDLFNQDHKVYVVYRDEKGCTQFMPLAPNPSWTREEWERRKGGKNLSALWVDGEIPHALADGGLDWEEDEDVE